MNAIQNRQSRSYDLRGFLILLFFCQVSLLFAQSGQDQNAVKATTVLTEGVTTVAGANALPYTDRVVEVQYVDGLGRPLQKVNQQASPSGHDIIQGHEYDERGQQSKTYLPYVSTTDDGSYHSNWTSEQAAFYQSSNDRIANTAFPWSESLAERSPLNRVLEQGAPGQEWQLGHHTLNTYFEANGGNEVIHWGISSAGELINEGYHPAGSLRVNVVVNESGHLIREYVNKRGETLLKKTQGDNGEWLETYYVQDGFGNLRFVLSPMFLGGFDTPDNGECGPEQSITGNTILTSYQGVSYRVAEGSSLKLSYNTLESFRFSHTDGCFYMRREGTTGQIAASSQKAQGDYPVRKIRISTALSSFEGFSYLVEQGNELTLAAPTAGELIFNTTSTPSFYAQVAALSTVDADTLAMYAYQYQYDDRQRMIAKKMPGSGWIYYVYDAWDRLILTQSENQRTKNPQEWSFVKYDVLNREAFRGVYSDSQNRSREAMQQAALVSGNLRYEERNSSVHEYTLNRSFPQDLSADEVLSVSYYDAYDFGFATSAPYTFHPELGHTQHYDQVQGKVTGGKTKVLDASGPWLKEVVYYSEESQAIQVVTDNQTGGFDRVSSRYSFDGKVLESYLTHQNPLAPAGQQNIYITNSYDYDHLGRKIREYQQINGGQEVLLAEHQYNELGEPVEKNLHSQDNGTNFLQSIDYRYNIRGWLSHINNADLTNDGVYNDDANDLFGMELKYTQASNELEGNAQYNGNVAEIHWNDAHHNRKRGYGFQYDAYGRITRAHYADYQSGGTAWSEHVGDFDLSGVQYDRNGNMMQLQRTGYRSDSIFGLMDNLSYRYQGNHLMAVTDQAPVQGYNDFQDRGATGNIDYSYDGNGNLMSDANKGIVQIDYNHLNLPQRVDMGGGNEIHYLYDADGRKLQKIVKQSGQADQNTWYMGTMVYNDNGLEFIFTKEGRAVPDGGSAFRYEYHYKDYLENTRLAFSDLDGNGAVDNTEILQVEHYYPFGMDFYGLNTPQTGPEHKHLYNGMERQDDFGLATYMADFRMLDPALARWWQIDPKAEYQYSFSPYLAIHNNPVRFNDPKGDIAPAVWAAIVYALQTGGETAIDIALGVTLTYLTGIPYTGWDIALDYFLNLIPGAGEARTAKKVGDVGVALSKSADRFNSIPGADKLYKQVIDGLDRFKNGGDVRVLENLRGYLFEFKLINASGNIKAAGLYASELVKSSKYGENLLGVSDEVMEVFKKYGDYEIDAIEDLGGGALKFIEAKTGKLFETATTIFGKTGLKGEGKKILTKLNIFSDYLKAGGKGKLEFVFPFEITDALKADILAKAKKRGIDPGDIIFRVLD